MTAPSPARRRQRMAYSEPMQISSLLGPGLHVLERGWLSSNNVLLDDADGATLIDTGHSVHAEQTLALLRQLLGGTPLRHVVNTHLHSDHCGGNAAVQREWAPDVRVPSGSLQAVQDWDEQALSYRPTRQRCERYTAQGSVAPGQVLCIGRRDWQVLAAPGHDPESVILFDARHGVLISADALWENGFGVVFPELEGEDAFDEVGATLDLIESLSPLTVIPGHGRVFTDVSGALARARTRLDQFTSSPDKHLRHAAKVLIKFKLLEWQRLPLSDFEAWARGTPYLLNLQQRMGQASFGDWLTPMVDELVKSGAAQREDGWLLNV